MKKKIQKLIQQFKYKYSPAIPSIDMHDFQSRRNWILFMAHRTGRFPVKEIYDRFMPTVSKPTVNNDLQKLEEAGLIRRERINNQHSFVVPLFEDSGVDKGTEIEQRKVFWFNIGLPTLSAILLFILLAVHLSNN